MTTKLLSASFVALLFSSVCFANNSTTNDTDTLVPAEMKAATSFCDENEGDAVLPIHAN